MYFENYISLKIQFMYMLFQKDISNIRKLTFILYLIC